VAEKMKKCDISANGRRKKSTFEEKAKRKKKPHHPNRGEKKNPYLYIGGKGLTFHKRGSFFYSEQIKGEKRLSF